MVLVKTLASPLHSKGLSRVFPISDKIDFKIKAVKRDKEGHYIMIKGSIQEEDITVINIYAPNLGALQYAAAAAKSLQPCPTLCDPIDGSPKGPPVPGIL